MGRNMIDTPGRIRAVRDMNYDYRSAAMCRSRRVVFLLLVAFALPNASAGPGAPAAQVSEWDDVLLAEESMDDLFESDDAEDESEEPAETPNTPVAPEQDAVTSETPADAERLTAEPAAPADQGAQPQPSATADEAMLAVPQSTTPVAPETVAAGSQSTFRMSGFVQNEAAYTYASPDHFSKFRTRAKVKLGGRLSERVKWQLAGDLSYDPNYDFNHFYNSSVRRDQSVDGYIDESFLDIDADSWEIRLGRQHIVWGEMVGLFFGDVVSALDLREFVLPDFETIRIPQWAARAEYFNSNFHADLIWLPFVTGNELGKFGSDFYLFPIELPDGVRANFRHDKMPHDVGEDSGFGARVSYLLDGWDMSLFYYTSPDRNQALIRRIEVAPSNFDLTFLPTHNRIHQVGATIAKDLGSVVLKAEAVETTDRLISRSSLLDADGLAKSNELRYVVGADWSGDGHNINVQVFQTWLQDQKPDMIFHELESGFSVLLTSTHFDPKITPEILWIRGLDRNEWLLEAKLTWNLSNDWRGILGADVFHGPQTGVLGEFHAKDRVYYELRYSF